MTALNNLIHNFASHVANRFPQYEVNEEGNNVEIIFKENEISIVAETTDNEPNQVGISFYSTDNTTDEFVNNIMRLFTNSVNSQA